MQGVDVIDVVVAKSRLNHIDGREVRFQESRPVITGTLYEGFVVDEISYRRIQRVQVRNTASFCIHYEPPLVRCLVLRLGLYKSQNQAIVHTFQIVCVVSDGTSKYGCGWYYQQPACK